MSYRLVYITVLDTIILLRVTQGHLPSNTVLMEDTKIQHIVTNQAYLNLNIMSKQICMLRTQIQIGSMRNCVT